MKKFDPFDDLPFDTSKLEDLPTIDMVEEKEAPTWSWLDLILPETPEEALNISVTTGAIFVAFLIASWYLGV